MITWDDISEIYEEYAQRKDARDIDFGNGMLDLIRLLRNDPAISTMSLGRMMNWLVVALPDNRFPAVHIKWTAPDIYEIFLAPERENDIPDVSVVSLSEAVSRVKACLHL